MDSVVKRLTPFAGILVFLAIWEIGVKLTKAPAYLLPAPSVIFHTFVAEFSKLAFHGWVTLYEMLLGYGLAVAVAIPLAIAITSSERFDRFTMPTLLFFQVVPKVAVAPLFLVWFGVGVLPKVLVAFLISFFPIVINSVIGMRSAEKEMIYLVQSMGASELTTFLKIRLPKALPSIFGGLKVGIGQAVVGATVGEFIAAERGLGYLQLISQVRLDTPLLFAAVVVLSLLGVLLFNAVAFAERIALPWSRVATDVAE